MRGPTVHLAIEADRVSAEVRGPRPWRGEAVFTDPDDLARVIGELAEAASVPRGARLHVRCAAPLVQLRRLEALPPLPRQELRRLVAHRPGRYFRKNGSPLVTDAVWLARGRRVALAAALEEPFAHAVIRGASVAGLVLEGITPAAGATAFPLSLLPASEVELRADRRIRWVRRALILAAALWVGLGVSIVWRVRRDLAQVERDLDQLRGPVAATLAAEREVDAALASIAAVDRPVEERLAPAMTLASTTTTLPDSAWLTAATIRRDGTRLLAGAAPRPSAYLARLERGGVLPGARIEGRTTEEWVAGRRVERFNIRSGGGSR